LGSAARFAAATFRVTGGHWRAHAGAIAHITEIAIAGLVADLGVAVIPMRVAVVVIVMAIVSLGGRNR